MSNDFQHIRHVKHARKATICEDCHHPISIGDPYLYWCGKSEGEFISGGTHEECIEWAGSVMCWEEGRYCLWGSDPMDELDLEELADKIRANPPSELMRSRLPRMWLTAVDAALATWPSHG